MLSQMGWNDRIPEDPHILFAEEQDRQAYEEWHHFLLEQERIAAETGLGLTSANVTFPLPAQPAAPTEEQSRAVPAVKPAVVPNTN